MRTLDEINHLIAANETQLAELESCRSELLREKTTLLHSKAAPDLNNGSTITNQSSQEEKITIFRSLFRGREDVYPRRFESKKTGKKATSRFAETNGSVGSAKSPRSVARIVEIANFFRSQIR
jgi:hypothetical protein